MNAALPQRIDASLRSVEEELEGLRKLDLDAKAAERVAQSCKQLHDLRRELERSGIIQQPSKGSLSNGVGKGILASQPVHTIAHDLNNLLTGVLGYAEMTAAGLGAHPLQGDLDRIREAARLATGQTRELLVMCRAAKRMQEEEE